MKKNGAATEITLGDACRNLLYEIVPGILVAFNEVRVSVLPIMSHAMDDCVCTINYATRGICGVYSSDGRFIYLRAGELMISNEQAAQSFEYPAGGYSGIEIYIMRQALERQDLLADFKIDVDQLIHFYLPRQHQTAIAENLRLLKNTLNDIVVLYQDGILDLNLLKLHTFYILRMLTAGAIECRPGYEGALSKSQVEKAKQAERIITLDLAKRIPISQIATGMGVSATSLKNYFKAVYGLSISEYLRKKRIERAKLLLESTNLSILDISLQVGYESQSKFAAMFHESLGSTPTEYRRANWNNRNSKYAVKN